MHGLLPGLPEDISAGFLPAMELELLAGRNFNAGQPNKDEIIISDDAARMLGFNNPQAAVGKRVSGWGSEGYSTIIGVTENYHQQSLKGPIFAYRISIEWWMFTLAGLLALIVALLAVSFQAIKAALLNPVKSLRSE